MRFLITAALVASLSTTNALAWGAKGHRLIASLAEKRLRAGRGEVMSKVTSLLGPGVTLASLAVCADSIRDYVSNKDKPEAIFPEGCIVSKEEAVAMFPSTGSWHFINIPVPAAANPKAHPSDVLDKACAERPPCILTQIDHFSAQLRDKTLDKRTRAIALMFLVHFVGDLHQPLHAVARQKDRGGNEVFVRLGSHVGRLHSTWDTYLVDTLQEQDVAAVIAPGKGTPKSWAWESYDAAISSVYADIPVQPSTFEHPIVLQDPEYREAATRVVTHRIRAASVRLAELLTKALRGQ